MAELEGLGNLFSQTSRNSSYPTPGDAIACIRDAKNLQITFLEDQLGPKPNMLHFRRWQEWGEMKRRVVNLRGEVYELNAVIEGIGLGDVDCIIDARNIIEHALAVIERDTLYPDNTTTLSDALEHGQMRAGLSNALQELTIPKLGRANRER